MKLHFHDSYSLRLFPAPPDDVDFQGELFTRSGFEPLSLPFSRVDAHCIGCTMGEQTIDIDVPGGSLLPGLLECKIVYFVPDKSFTGGFRRVCANSRLPIELVRGQGDVAASVLTVNIHQPTTVLPSPEEDCDCEKTAALSHSEIDSIIDDVIALNL